jgi:hypothetical protein
MHRRRSLAAHGSTAVEEGRDLHTESRSAKAAWAVGGWVFAWLTLMAVIQRGFGGYLAVFVAMFAIVVLGLLSGAFSRWLWSVRAWVTVPAALAVWIWFAGSYSYIRDIVMILLATAATVLAFPTTRQWAWSLRARLRGMPGPHVALRTTARFQLCWLLLSWLLVSIADQWAEAGRIPIRGNVVAPASMPDPWKGLRVGLALSGGGYRAAMMHAGVLHELQQHGVPVTHLSTVSGGSIIGAFMAAGGAPSDFAEAVKRGRFRLTRDLTWTWNALRLPAPLHVPWLEIDAWPFGNFSRIDVQANLIDRVLLGGMPADDRAHLTGPELIVNMTDLRYGLSVGFTKDGVLLFGPIAHSYMQQFHQQAAITIHDLPYDIYYGPGTSANSGQLSKLSRRVALSGAFPGAFPNTEFDLSIPSVGGARASPPLHLKLALADGGIRDNLGLNAMQMLDFSARTQGDRTERGASGNPVDARWQLDLILVSDGGKALQAPSELSALGSISRAIDLNGLETGALRGIPNDGKPPIQMLSYLSSLTFSPELVVAGRTMDEFRDHPEAFLARIDDKTLLSIADLNPDQNAAKPVVSEFEKAQANPNRDRKSRSRDCVTGSSDPVVVFACARIKLERLVAGDIWQTTSVFRETPTLQDHFSANQADAIFRFGRYLVRLKWPCIRQKLDEAATSAERRECDW